MKNKVFVFLPIVMFASACYVSTNTTVLDPSLHLAQTCPRGVKLYTSPDRVLQPYREVALLHSAGEALYSDERDMYDSMRKEAAGVGANGIIISGIDEPNAITKVAGEIAQKPAERKGRAVAIYVAADSASSAVACTKK